VINGGKEQGKIWWPSTAGGGGQISTAYLFD